MKHIKKEQYIKDNVSNFKEFKNLLKQQQKQMQDYAQKSNLKHAKIKQLENDVKALKSELTYKNDYPYTHKNTTI